MTVRVSIAAALAGTALVGAVLAGTALTAGCAPKTPDYQSFWTTSSAPTTTVTGDLVPIGKYLQDQGVGAEQVAPGSLPDLLVSIPTPRGWSRQQNPKLGPATEVIAKGDKFPRAILTVLKLTGEFDSTEAIKHSFADAELSPNFRRLDSSLDDFGGFPSAMVQFNHNLDGQPVRSWFRTVLATGGPTGSPPTHQQYLVQLTIFTWMDHAATEAADVEAIMTGFTVKAK